MLVTGTQVYARVLEPGPQVSTLAGKPVWEVLCDRKGRSHIVRVVRTERGKLIPARGGVYRNGKMA